MSLKTQYIHPNADAPVMVVFGGNAEMRNQVVGMLEDFGRVSVFAALSEDEGLQYLKTLPRVDFVLIGGRYAEDQRIRIRKATADTWPQAFTSEPGIDYTYGDAGVIADLKRKLNL